MNISINCSVHLPMGEISEIHFSLELLWTEATLHRNHFPHEPLCTGTTLHRNHFAHEPLCTGTDLCKEVPGQSDSCAKWFLCKVIPVQSDSCAKWFLCINDTVQRVSWYCETNVPLRRGLWRKMTQCEDDFAKSPLCKDNWVHQLTGI